MYPNLDALIHSNKKEKWLNRKIKWKHKTEGNEKKCNKPLTLISFALLRTDFHLTAFSWGIANNKYISEGLNPYIVIILIIMWLECLEHD